MSKLAHRIYIYLMAITVIVAFIYFIYKGFSFYTLSIETRFFHPDYDNLKPSGIFGHGLGIIGSLFIIIGISVYMLRKRSKLLRRFGLLKHWLEFHIFLCTLGPIMILFHTSFKFGGIVSISFWSMVAVFLSGIVGRYIYIQIPRSIEGRELSLDEVKAMKNDIRSLLSNSNEIDEQSIELILKLTKKKIDVYQPNVFKRYISGIKRDRKTISDFKKEFNKSKLSHNEFKKILSLIKSEISLNNRIERLDMMKNLFKYWHVAHLPFAIVMITIMVIHVAIVLTFGYKWIF